MPSTNQNNAESPQTRNRNKTMSGDPRDDRRLSQKPNATARTSAEKAPANDAQNQAAIEEFGEEGMGVAPKE